MDMRRRERPLCPGSLVWFCSTGCPLGLSRVVDQFKKLFLFIFNFVFTVSFLLSFFTTVFLWLVLPVVFLRLVFYCRFLLQDVDCIVDILFVCCRMSRLVFG